MYTGEIWSLLFTTFFWILTLIGEEADVASGLAEPSSNIMETAIHAREQVNNLMERFVPCPCFQRPNFIYSIIDYVMVLKLASILL